MVKCFECGKDFKQITNRHLKFSHNLTTEEYKIKHPSAELFDKSIIEFFSIRSKEANKNRKGIPRSDEVKEKIRNTKSKQEIIPWNKGISQTNEVKNKLREKGIARHKKWLDEGTHPQVGKVLSENIKNKISKSVKNYALFNKEELRERAKKAVDTKISTGYYEKLAQKTIEKYKNIFTELDFATLSYNDGLVELQCNKCDTIHTRSIKSYHHGRMCRGCFPTLNSNNENELYNYLNSLGVKIIRGDKSILAGNFEIDFLLPDYAIGIEYNGLYWHSEKNGKGKFYHLTKRNKCLEKGIKLIQIFEDEWLNKPEIVKNRLKAILGISNNQYARNGIIKELSSKEAKDFIDLHHIYGYTPASLKYGLLINDNIEAVMTFTRPTKAKNQLSSNYDYELSRYCSNGRILGGASKLFKYFVNEINPNKVVSYSDLRWGIGNLYENLGFEFSGNTLPNYWYTADYKSRIYRFNLRKNELDDKNLTEWENRLNQGYDRIWDCGHSKWIWNKNRGINAPI